MKFSENGCECTGDMEQTPNSRANPMTLTPSLGSWDVCFAHSLTYRNIWVKFIEIIQRVHEIWRGHKNVTDGMADAQTDRQTKGIPFTLHPLLSRGLTSSYTGQL